VLAFLVFLVVENDWRLRLVHGRTAIVTSCAILCGILALTAFQQTDLRTYSELAQLALYITLFVLLSGAVTDGKKVLDFLFACAWGSCIVAVFALIWIVMGWTASPYIISGRGSNELSVFLSLLGVVPCAAMLTRTRNPAYLLAALLMCYVQFLATSRSNMAVSGLVLLVAGFLWTRIWLARACMVVAAIWIMFRNVPSLQALYEAQLNFSARERVGLLNHGWDLALERFWTGWGWGATSRLAGSAPGTVQAYPHFHNTYIQLMVELGLLGWIVIGLAAWLLGRWLSLALFEIRQVPLIALVACSGMGLAIAGLFDAMLFGADRASQVVILLALCSRAVALSRTSSQAEVEAAVRQAMPFECADPRFAHPRCSDFRNGGRG